MRITRLVGLAVVLAVMMGSEARAQVVFEFTPFAGATLFLADPPSQFALHQGAMPDLIVDNGAFSSSYTVGVNAGFRFGERWAIEGMGSWTPTELKSEGHVDKASAYMYGITGLFYIPLEGKVTPFVGLGVGAETFKYNHQEIESHTDMMGNVVGGLYLAFSETAGLRFEARDCFMPFESGIASVDDSWENDLMLTVGLSFRRPIG